MPNSNNTVLNNKIKKKTLITGKKKHTIPIQSDLCGRQQHVIHTF